MYIINSHHKNIDTMQFVYWGLKPKCTSVHGVCRTHFYVYWLHARKLTIPHKMLQCACARSFLHFNIRLLIKSGKKLELVFSKWQVCVWLANIWCKTCLDINYKIYYWKNYCIHNSNVNNIRIGIHNKFIILDMESCGFLMCRNLNWRVLGDSKGSH